ncbi:hypothetical protein RJ639_004572 [Escallonia herrerae]|uniref:Heat shock protein 70 n=1 Tax=Escallonia herrerae TaxID=1293975 RepID=A0AA88W4J8_9ASTE|nr:hypothetical protein RJ639_004572 [Escallonia herrerae]
MAAPPAASEVQITFLFNFFSCSLKLLRTLKMTEGEGQTIGIDLGTTYSCVGVWQDDHVEIITNDQGSRTTPSTVAFSDTERLIGEAAKNQEAMNPVNTIFGKKLFIYLDCLLGT